MNLILHQFKTDVRHYRGLLILFWLALAGQWVLVGTVAGELKSISMVAVALQVLISALLVAQVIQADALVDTTAFWMTRPIRRFHLFCCKTVFFLMLILAPFLLVQSIIWIRDVGFSPGLWAKGFGEYLLIATSILCAVATVAALTKTVRQFLLYAVGVFAVFLLWIGLAFTVEKSGIFGKPLDVPYNGIVEINRLMLMWFVLGVTMSVAWVMQASRNLWRPSVVFFAVGLLSSNLICNYWPQRLLLVQPPRAAELPLKLSVLHDDDSMDYEPGSQLIWSHFRLDGLNEHQLAIVSHDRGSFEPTDGPQLLINQGVGAGYFYSLQNYQAEILKIIQSYYPSNTLWFGNLSSQRQTALQAFVSGNRKSTPAITRTNAPGKTPLVKRSNEGRFSGEIEFTVLNYRKVADLPLEAGMSGDFIAGERLSLSDVTPAMDGIHTTFFRTFPDLLLDTRSAAENGQQNFSEGSFVYVLYQPEFDEAFCVRSEVYYSGGAPVTLGAQGTPMQIVFPFPALRARLTGIALQDWLRGARLQIYQPTRVGQSHTRFDETNYVFQADRTQALRKKNDASGIAAIQDAKLPDRPTDAQLHAYITTIAANLPESFDSVDSKVVERKLSAISAEGLPTLTRMLPLNPRFDANFSHNLLQKQATRNLMPDLLRALRRDVTLASVFREKGWEEDARETILEMLPQHGIPLPPDALIIAASAHDPKTYPDLTWHFIYQPVYSYELLGELRKCPGFDVTGAVRQAWKRAQLGLRADDPLCLAAAQEGLPGAMDASILKLDRGTQNRSLFLKQLASITTYNGPKPEFGSWLVQNLGQFRYDAAQKRYVSAN